MPGTGRKYQHHSVARKREIVEASLGAGASVARIAREHGVNANQVWAWRKLYSEGRLDIASPTLTTADMAAQLLAVDVIESGVVSLAPGSAGGTLQIVMGSTRLTVTGTVDPVMLQTAIAALRT